jgi:hypothetical protein
MPRDPEKARASQRRYREKVKVAKYGPDTYTCASFAR